MEKIKRFTESERGKDIMVVAIVILVGLGSFELGRLSESDRSGGIQIEYPEEMLLGQEANALSGTGEADYSNIPQKGGFFASSRGTKYYPVNCSAGKTIKEANKVWFDAREEAEQAGYELSSSCR